MIKISNKKKGSRSIFSKKKKSKMISVLCRTLQHYLYFMLRATQTNQFCSSNKRSFRRPGGVGKGLDSTGGPKSLCGNCPLWSPVVSRGIPWLSVSPVVYHGIPFKLFKPKFKSWRQQRPNFEFDACWRYMFFQTTLNSKSKMWPRQRLAANTSFIYTKYTTY